MTSVTQIPQKIEQVKSPLQEVSRQLANIGSSGSFAARLDPRVRDTWEIAKSRISIDQSRWINTLSPQLERICRSLRLAQGSKLKAELHNMLVYAPGQFFAAHQDSEKANNMIGTLVVSLPSRFASGRAWSPVDRVRPLEA